MRDRSYGYDNREDLNDTDFSTRRSRHWEDDDRHSYIPHYSRKSEDEDPNRYRPTYDDDYDKSKRDSDDKDPYDSDKDKNSHDGEDDTNDEFKRNTSRTKLNLLSSASPSCEPSNQQPSSSSSNDSQNSTKLEIEIKNEEESINPRNEVKENKLASNVTDTQIKEMDDITLTALSPTNFTSTGQYVEKFLSDLLADPEFDS